VNSRPKVSFIAEWNASATSDTIALYHLSVQNSDSSEEENEEENEEEEDMTQVYGSNCTRLDATITLDSFPFASPWIKIAGLTDS
jgi:hypothetical protein